MDTLIDVFTLLVPIDLFDFIPCHPGMPECFGARAFCVLLDLRRNISREATSWCDRAKFSVICYAKKATKRIIIPYIIQPKEIDHWLPSVFFIERKLRLYPSINVCAHAAFAPSASVLSKALH